MLRQPWFVNIFCQLDNKNPNLELFIYKKNCSISLKFLPNVFNVLMLISSCCFVTVKTICFYASFYGVVFFIFSFLLGLFLLRVDEIDPEVIHMDSPLQMNPGIFTCIHFICILAQNIPVLELVILYLTKQLLNLSNCSVSDSFYFRHDYETSARFWKFLNQIWTRQTSQL